MIDVAQALGIVRPEWQRFFKSLDYNLEAQEMLPTRCRGGEFPALSQNLLCKTGLVLSRKRI